MLRVTRTRRLPARDAYRATVPPPLNRLLYALLIRRHHGDSTTFVPPENTFSCTALAEGNHVYRQQCSPASSSPYPRTIHPSGRRRFRELLFAGSGMRQYHFLTENLALKYKRMASNVGLLLATTPMLTAIVAVF